MSLITIDPNKCNRDGLCVQACPISIITMGKGQVPGEIAEAGERCIRCGHCVAVCPEGALANSLLAENDFLPLPENVPGADEVEALLLSRRSIRAFRNKPVPQETLDRLLEVVRRAPTASNSQQVAWCMVRDGGRLDRVRELTLQWMRTIPRLAGYVKAAGSGRDSILRGAPLLAVAHGPAEYGWTDMDCTIALTYMELMAASQGLGACWAGLVIAAARQVPELAYVLGVAEKQRVGGALMLGLPRQKHLLVPPRNPVNVSWL